ncbi:MAG TPA: immunoglobulin domain-containing protein, partial [Verrucomicrobiae bacterium]|nr:immunoglobulin domain-containing protein [Verrucomicrobiae bacterium]
MSRVAAFSVSGIESLAFRPSDGALFGATSSKLYTINIINGTATLVGSYGSAHNLGTGQNIRFAQDGNLYVSNTSTNTDIYRVSTSTGNATWMGEAIGSPYLTLENSAQNMYGVYINLGSSTNPYPVLVDFNLSSFVVGGTNANGSTHQITINLVGGGTNFPANFNFSGNTSQAVTNLTIPVSAVGPVAQTVCPGDSVVFSTVASGTGPFSYAWMKNNAAMSGQTNSSLTLNNVSASDAATYSVIVSGLMGSVTNSATLTVNTLVTATPLNNVTDCPGDSAFFTTTASGTGPFSYAWLKNGTPISGQNSNSLTLNNVSASDAATYSVIVSGACGSVTNSAILTVNAPVTVTIPPASQTTVVGNNVTFSVTATGTGLNYQWLLGGSVIGNGSSLSLNNVTTSQAGVYSVVVSGACGSPVTNSATLTVNVPVSVTVPPVNQTTVVGSNVTFSVTATGTGLTYQWLFGGSVIGNASSLTLNNVTTGQAGVYTVIVSGAAGNSVTNTATLTVNVPVSVTVPPVDQTTVVGSNVTFSVTATGTGLSYQWLFGGSVIGTASSLTLNNVTTGQAGVYTVIVSGAAGNPVTNTATLTVNVPVSVTVPPVNQTTVVGSNVTFSVTATGTGLTYQWLFGGSVVGNASSLTLNSVTTGQAGVYTVIVSGAAGNSVTNTATLTVNVPVSVTVPPVDQTTVVGS